MKKFWYWLLILKRVYRVTRNPDDTSSILQIGPYLHKLGLMERSLQKLKQDPASRQLIQNQSILQRMDLQKLKQAPTGSLGAVFAEHMLSHHLDPQFFGEISWSDEGTYILLRQRQMHDLWHVVTGFSTAVEDELGLLAFTFAQTRAPLVPFLIGASFLKAAIKDQSRAPQIFDRVARGWQIGSQAQNLFAYDWEKNWVTPLEQVRADLKITPVEPLTA